MKRDDHLLDRLATDLRLAGKGGCAARRWPRRMAPPARGYYSDAFAAATAASMPLSP